MDSQGGRNYLSNVASMQLNHQLSPLAKKKEALELCSKG